MDNFHYGDTKIPWDNFLSPRTKMGLHNIHRYLVYCSLLRKGNPRCPTERSSEIITVSDMFFHVLQVTSKVVFCPAYILNVFFHEEVKLKSNKKKRYIQFSPNIEQFTEQTMTIWTSYRQDKK